MSADRSALRDVTDPEGTVHGAHTVIVATGSG
jgi:hypothetical protein